MAYGAVVDMELTLRGGKKKDDQKPPPSNKDVASFFRSHNVVRKAREKKRGSPKS